MAETTRRDIQSLRQLLTARGWQQTSKGDRFDRFYPPSALKLGDKFYVTLPKGAVSSGTGERYFVEVSKILSQIYGGSPESIEGAVADATVFSVRLFGDNETRRGAISLVDFEAFLWRIRDLIRDTADFATSNLPFTGEAIEAATAYLQACLFLQTEKGSFVTRIELPSAMTLRPGDMLLPATTGKDASDRLSDVLAFVSERVFKDDPTIYEDEIFANSSHILNVDVLDDVKSVVEHLAERSVSFHFARQDLDKSVASFHIAAPEIEKITKYVEFVRDKLSQYVPIDLIGTVVQLRSRDPEGNRNLVTIQAADRSIDLPIFVALDSALYSEAVDAHVHKRPVRVRGNAVKLKTQLKIVELFDFGLLGGAAKSRD